MKIIASTNCLAYFKNVFKTLIFFGIGFAVLYWVFHNQQIAFEEQCMLEGTYLGNCSLWDKVVSDLSSANFGWIAIVSALLYDQ